MDIVTFLGMAAAIQAAQATARVARLLPSGDVVYGTARRLTGDPSRIQDNGLQVTTDQGWEVTWPLTELADEYARGEFVVNPSE